MFQHCQENRHFRHLQNSFGYAFEVIFRMKAGQCQTAFRYCNTNYSLIISVIVWRYLRALEASEIYQQIYLPFYGLFHVHKATPFRPRLSRVTQRIVSESELLGGGNVRVRHLCRCHVYNLRLLQRNRISFGGCAESCKGPSSVSK